MFGLDKIVGGIVDSVAGVVGDVAGAALPFVGAAVGGPLGGILGSAAAPVVDDLITNGVPEVLKNVMDLISPQHQCCPSPRPQPWTPPCGPGGSGGNSNIDKLFKILAAIQKKLDDTLNNFDAKATNGEELTAEDTTRLQQAFSEFNAGVAAISAALKSFGDANAGIAQRIA